ncbi:MAG: GAF domain-containing protein [Candidatus Eremiobacteraeota bacterium]|nr:GAF domain-containing protein [Candidatus Eremiobacteraeota bacterium]
MLIPERVPHPADRLATLTRMIQVTRSIPDLSTVLEVLMDHLLELLGAERGFIMLVDPELGTLEFKSARNFSKENLFDDDFQVSRSIVYEVFGSGQALLTSNAQSDERFANAVSIQEYGLRAVMCAPVVGNQGNLGVLYVDNRLRLGAFEDEDLDFLETFAAQTASVLERAQLDEEKNRIRDLFSRYVSAEVVDAILARPSQALAADRRRVTVMFCDLRGFSSLSETVEPDELLTFLNAHFESMTEVILAHQGTVMSYLGDGLLAVFGAPLDLDSQEARAIGCARQMVEIAAERDVKIGVGLATGEAVVGDLGSTRRREYTVIGDVVNTAARLEKLTKEKGCPVLCDDETYRCSQLHGGQHHGQVNLAGKTLPVSLWSV